MSIKSNVVDAVLYVACATPLVVAIVMTLWWLSDNTKVYQPVANGVANEVANDVANSVTAIETEIYRVVCVESADGYCKEYSVRRITKE